MLTNEQTDYLFKNVAQIPYRQFLIETFTPPIPGEKDDHMRIPLREEVMLTKGILDNYDGPPILTTVPIFITNVIVLAVPLGKRIPYVNESFTPSVVDKIQSRIIDLIISSKTNNDMPEDMKIDIAMFYYYFDSLTYLAHFTELSTSAYSEKSLTTDPKALKRAAELYAIHKHELDDPKVIIAIENELIAMDKAWLEGDIGSVFYESLGKKGYDVHRKSLLLTQGSVPKFDKEETGTLLVKNSLQDGWTKEDFAAIVNNSRRGTYGRGMSTAQGGYLTKIMYRVYSSVKVLADECGTQEGIRLILDNPVTYLGRNILEQGKTVTLTSENINKYIGKEVLLRDPFYCKIINGFCYNCLTDTTKVLGAEVVVSQISGIGSTILNNSMKAMHGVKSTIIKIKYEDYFIEI